jgi:hypothetical protein
MSYGDHDDLDGLGEYLGAYSGLGSIPTSLGGYGFSGARQLAELGAGDGNPIPQGRAGTETAEGPKPLASNLKIGTARWSALRAMLVKDVRWGLNRIGYSVGTSDKPDASLTNAFAAYTKKIKDFYYTDPDVSKWQADIVPASGGFDSSHWVWANTYVLSKLGADARAGSTVGTAPTPASNVSTSKTTTPASSPAPAGNQSTTSVAAVQDVLIRLGWRAKNKTTGPISKDLTDGLYGGTVVANWQASASKRKLNPSITKASADGLSVTVNENTFLQLKNVADNLVPPEKGGVVIPAPGGTTTITEARLTEVLGRLAGAPRGTPATWERLVLDYQTRAKGGSYDTSISKDQSGAVVVNSKTWDAFVQVFNQTAPAPDLVKPAEKSAVETAMAEISGASTSKLSAATLTKFFNIGIVAGKLQHEPFKGDKWSPEYAGLIAGMQGVTGPQKTAWEQLLVPGKLVATDRKSLKLPPAQVQSIQKVVNDYEAQKKAENTIKAGFTKADSAQVIGFVNALNVTSKKFDKSGGVDALKDALETFLQNTKQSVSGATVWVQATTKDVYVNSDVLVLLKKATDAENARSQATQTYRDKMVSDAINASTASVGIDPLQLAFIETVESKKAGANEKIYAKVKQTGVFDGPTREAYTALAQTAIIGPSVQQFQKLLQDQLGPQFKTSDVVAVKNKVWDDYLKQAQFQRQGSYAMRYDASKNAIKTLPSIADKIMAATKARMDRIGQKDIDKQKKDDLRKALGDALAKSTFIVSVYDVQQGVLASQFKKQLKAPGVSVTGVADAALGEALKNFSSAAFSIDPIPHDSWKQYLDATGIKSTKSGVSFGFVGANYVALPQSTASKLTSGSTDWMKKNGVPAGYAGVAALNPLSDSATLQRFKKGSLVKGRLPAKPGEKVILVSDKEADKDEQKRLEAKAKKLRDEAKKLEAETKRLKERARQKRAEAKAAREKAASDATNKAAQDAAAKAEADARAAEEAAARAAEAARLAAQQVSNTTTNTTTNTATNTTTNTSTTTGGGDSGGGVPQPFVPAPPEPTPTPEPAPITPAPTPEPTPAPVQEAGMFSPGSLLLMSAVGLGFLFFSGDKDKKQQTGYSTRSGGRK